METESLKQRPVFPTTPRYQLAKQRAWQLLLALDVSALPFDPFDVLATLGVNVLSYSELMRQSRCTFEDARILTRSREGGLFLFGGQWCFLYNDFCPWPERVRWTAAHELAHYLLGHLLDYTAGQLDAAPKAVRAAIERESDACAAELLAPLCILYAIGATDAETIRRVCHISRSAAEKCEHFFQYVHGRYYPCREEVLLCQHFQPFLGGSVA